MTPLDALHQSYDELLDICEALELVADALPDRIPAARCALLADTVVAALERSHGREEDFLLPLLAASPRPELRHLAIRLRQEHAFDSATALEIQDALTALATGTPALSADATGYLLRAFFESLRRHVHAEQDLIILINDITPSAGRLN